MVAFIITTPTITLSPSIEIVAFIFIIVYVLCFMFDCSVDGALTTSFNIYGSIWYAAPLVPSNYQFGIRVIVAHR